MEVIYNKLVRDKVVPRILKNGEQAKWRILYPEEMLSALRNKILEESVEVVTAAQSGTRGMLIVEIADVVQPLMDAVKRHGVMWDVFHARRLNRTRDIEALAKKLPRDVLLDRFLHQSQLVQQPGLLPLQDVLFEELISTYAVMKAYGIEQSEMENARVQKYLSHGGYNDRIFLISTG